MSREYKDEYKSHDCFENNLSVFTPTGWPRQRIDFPELSDLETISYVMCGMCKWSSYRLAKQLKAHKYTIENALEQAIKKRKPKT